MRMAISLVTAGLLAACGQAGGGNGAADTGGNGAAANAVASEGAAPAPPTGGSGGGAASAILQMQPGEWEISMTLPNGGSLPGTRVCLTPEDVGRGAAAMVGGGGRQQQGIDCDYSGVTIAGGRIQGTSTCRQEGGISVSVTMDGTMSPTGYDVNQRIRSTINGQTRETEGHIVGRRIGECQAGRR